MVEAWYLILAGMLATYAVLDGITIGSGTIVFIVAKSDSERRQVSRALGPLWSWHEVWLIASGGVLFVAFPRILASALAGIYLAVFLLLWALILRGVAFEVAGHIDDRMWRSAWDFVFSAASAVLALLLGAAFGNVVRGFPLDPDGRFTLAFFTNWRASGHVGLLDWYTVSIGLFAVVTLAAHGASFLAWKTGGAVCERSRQLAKLLWRVTFAALLVVSIETAAVRPQFFGGMTGHPLGLVMLTIALLGASAVLNGQGKGREAIVFAGSCAFIGGLLAGAAASLYPVMLASTIDPAASVNAPAAAASPHALAIAALWWPFGLILSIGYAFFVARSLRGRVTSSELR